jgi:dTMP kinase
VSSRGRFITLEGGEGAGKTTQAELLVTALQACGVPVLRTREPGGSPGAEQLRSLLLGGSIDWAPRSETLLHFAARAEHIAKTIEPALADGTWVVCDRFYDSTIAYQGHGQGADRRFILEQIRLLAFVPDLTFVLDVPEPVAEARLRGRGTVADRYEVLGRDFHARVRNGFRVIAAGEPDRCVLIDASTDAASVHTAMMAVVSRRFAIKP